MSGTARQTFVYAIEDNYAETPKAKQGETDMLWFIPPPGSWFTSSHSRNISTIYEVGRKRLTDFNYGKISGTWQWQFVLDYNYLEPFLLFFEGYTYGDYQTITEAQAAVGEEPKVWAEWGVHSFFKTESGIPRSFTVRRKRLHTIAGGAGDEVTELNGCICTTMQMSQSAGNSEVNVVLSGIYSTESMNSDLTDLELDYMEDKAISQVEFGCTYAGNIMFTGVQNWAIRIGNNIQGVYGVGYPCVRTYYENETNNSFSLTAFANNPKQLAQRVYSGGFDNTRTTPINEGAKPIPQIEIHSRSNVIESFASTTAPVVITELRYMMDIVILNCSVAAMTWESGDGTKLMDKLSNGRCENISLSFVNKCPQSYLAPVRTDPFWEKHLIRSV